VPLNIGPPWTHPPVQPLQRGAFHQFPPSTQVPRTVIWAVVPLVTIQRLRGILWTVLVIYAISTHGGSHVVGGGIRPRRASEGTCHVHIWTVRSGGAWDLLDQFSGDVNPVGRAVATGQTSSQLPVVQIKPPRDVVVLSRIVGSHAAGQRCCTYERRVGAVGAGNAGRLKVCTEHRGVRVGDARQALAIPVGSSETHHRCCVGHHDQSRPPVAALGVSTSSPTPAASVGESCHTYHHV
jgi:hypothetical protein